MPYLAPDTIGGAPYLAPDEPPSAGSTVTGVTVSPTAATVVNGSSQQYTATVQGTNSPSQAVTWAISGAGSISSTGLATGPVGSYTVTATSVQDPSISGTATFNVVEPGATISGTVSYHRMARSNLKIVKFA